MFDMFLHVVGNLPPEKGEETVQEGCPLPVDKVQETVGEAGLVLPVQLGETRGRFFRNILYRGSLPDPAIEAERRELAREDGGGSQENSGGLHVAHDDLEGLAEEIQVMGAAVGNSKG